MKSMLFGTHAASQHARMHEIDTHTHAHMRVVSMVSGVSPASLNLRWAMNDHMEVFFLVKPAGLLHDSSPGTTCAFFFYYTQMEAVLNTDLLLRQHAAATSPPHTQLQGDTKAHRRRTNFQQLLRAKIKTIVQHSSQQNGIHPCFLAPNGSGPTQRCALRVILQSMHRNKKGSNALELSGV